MQMHFEPRVIYASLGLWLIVSPFLLFGGQASLMNARVVETGFLMLCGLAALWVACLSLPKQRLLQAIAGLMLGISMFLAPEVIHISDSVVTVRSARLIGSIFVLCALVEANDLRTAQTSH